MKLKKIYMCIAIIILCFIVCVCSIQTFKNMPNIFWNSIARQFDKEEKERQEKIQNGDIVKGKDTLLIWGNTFEIGHYSSGNHLSMKNKDYSFSDILKNIEQYKVIDGNLYIVSQDGVAIINKDNICRLYYDISDETFTDEEKIGREDYYTNKLLENENIQYLSNIDEFSIDEQEALEELKINTSI